MRPVVSGFVAMMLALGAVAPGALGQVSSYRLQRPGESYVKNAYASGGSQSQFVVRTTPTQPSSDLGLGRSIAGSFAPPPPPPPQQRAPFYNGSLQDAFGIPDSFKQNLPFRGSTAVFSVPTISELKRISSRDVVIIIDKSRSMMEADCPSDNLPMTLSRFFLGGPSFASGMLTRWEWCRRQTMHVASQLARLPDSNMKLVLFDDRVSEFDNVNLNSISQIFNQFSPSGGTNATKALKTVFQEYFERKKFARVRPLSVVFITDGAPASPRSLKDLLIETSLKVDGPGEIQVSFLQIGQDSDGNRLLPELDQELVPDGARYDIVSCRDFGSVSRSGLMRALLDTAR